MKKRRIHLYGHLREKFGEFFDIAAASVADAIRILEANFPGQFCAHVRNGSYNVIVGPLEGSFGLDEKQLRMRFKNGDFHIVPVPHGAGGSSRVLKAVVTIVTGIALIATAFVGAGIFAGASLSALGSTAIGGITWGNIGLFGAALALSGISQLLTPTPKEKTNDQQNSNVESYFFNGALNSVAEGECVPVIYGRIRCGSTIVYGGVYDEDAWGSTTGGTLFGDKLNGGSITTG